MSKKLTAAPPVRIDEGDLLTTAQAAALLGLSVDCLVMRRKNGVPPAWIKLGRVVRYRRSVLAAYVDACEQRTRKPVEAA